MAYQIYYFSNLTIFDLSCIRRPNQAANMRESCAVYGWSPAHGNDLTTWNIKDGGCHWPQTPSSSPRREQELKET
uniref:Uncharacterized protein n=1 Tax=Oryza punctata TaxID=4537 RepID=A0A0E0K7R4_ORYPU